MVPYTRGRERGTAPREVLRQARALAAGRLQGGAAAGADGELVPLRRRRASPICCAPWPPSTASSASASPRPTRWISPPTSSRAIAETPKVCKHVHLPLQTASDAVLARMRRGYTYAQFRELVRRAARRHARHRHHHRPAGRASATKPRRSSRPSCARRKSCASTARSCSSTPSAQGTAAARKMPDTVPERGEAAQALAEVIALQTAHHRRDLAAQVGTPRARCWSRDAIQAHATTGLRAHRRLPRRGGAGRSGRGAGRAGRRRSSSARPSPRFSAVPCERATSVARRALTRPRRLVCWPVTVGRGGRRRPESGRARRRWRRRSLRTRDKTAERHYATGRMAQMLSPPARRNRTTCPRWSLRRSSC